MKPFLLLFLVACQSQTSVIKSAKELSVTPSFSDLGTVAVGDSVSEEIKLTHLKGDAIKVVDIQIQNIDGKEFSTDESLQFTVDVDTTEVLTVVYNPQSEGYHRARLTIATDEEQTPTHEVELRGGALLPIADISPSFLDFGPVVEGASVDLSVNLANLGTVPLSLASLSFSNADFSSTQTATTVEAGASLSIPVRFTAPDANRAIGTMGLDLGPVALPDVSLRANSCEDGDAVLYDSDADGITSCGGDCDDSDSQIHPGVAETCDGVDQNCDGSIDEGTRCVDDDNDGYSEQQGDCDDTSRRISPDATENPSNGIDDDCDGITDLGDQDLDADGYGATADCDDSDGAIHPGAAELADAIDNNCDGRVDEGTVVYDDDGDGYNERAGDCDDTDALVSPAAAEVADHLDNNCNGKVDEGTLSGDDDGDGFSEDGGDCDDGNAAISPAAVEVAGNAVDEDCDGVAR